MQLTKFTDYALRVLIALANHPEARVTAGDLARRYRVSPAHLAKVVSWLSREGYVAAERGRSGGLALAKSAEEIDIGAVVRAAESGAPLVECFDAAQNRCPIAPVCGLGPALRQAEEAFFLALSQHRLSDFARRPHAVRALLDREPDDAPRD